MSYQCRFEWSAFYTESNGKQFYKKYFILSSLLIALYTACTWKNEVQTHKKYFYKKKKKKSYSLAFL